MILASNTLNEICELRKNLHANAELSGKESKTARIITQFIKQYKPDEIIDKLGGEGVAFIFGKSGKTVLIRCELDALPINETISLKYSSKTSNVSHKCGHDGHMAIVAGVAAMLAKNPLHKGRVVLLFQPAEETGQGAKNVLNDPKYQKIKPEYAFALHNIPGYPQERIIVKDKVFAAASKGMIIEFNGVSSHAGEPEKGNSPAEAMAELVQEINSINQSDKFKDLTFSTIVHMRLGEVAFGTNPGYGVLMATLRAYLNEDLEELDNHLRKAVESIAQKFELKCGIKYTEEFSSTVNNKEAVQIIEKAAKINKLEVENSEVPFRWSEDFGYFTASTKGALFGLGAGVDQPQLHRPEYDFPDEIIASGVKIFYQIIREALD